MIGKTHEVVDASPGEGYIAPDMSTSPDVVGEPWARSVVAEVLDDGKVVVWPDQTEEESSTYLDYISVGVNNPKRHYFLVDVTLTPAKEMA